ncbi:hypothetical protein KZP23_17350 [Echinicola marina]|uniref:hypothetical protein n=1 Tax=Echinicola marina TaxID=2859768 RepID=UPI001CF6467C|nr:hypothetical protein [Echinicola marina]UCS92446.1 hypothetical protein KZP23_17350 [Echinicola marina]
MDKHYKKEAVDLLMEGVKNKGKNEISEIIISSTIIGAFFLSWLGIYLGTIEKEYFEMISLLLFIIIVPSVFYLVPGILRSRDHLISEKGNWDELYDILVQVKLERMKRDNKE